MDKYFSPPDFFIGRQYKVVEISRGLADKNILLLKGPPGSGKTTLLKYYANSNPLQFSRINFYKAREFSFSENSFTEDRFHSGKLETILTIIDGLDEVDADAKRQRLISIAQKFINYGHKIIISTREYINTYSIDNEATKVTLAGLTLSEAAALFKMRLGLDNFERKSKEEIKSIFDAVQNNPLGIVAAAELMRTTNYSAKQIIKLLYDKKSYENLLAENQPISQIILQPTSQIISDVSIINNSLIEKVRIDPNLIHSITSRQFEELVAELFEKDGYNVSLTQRTHDGGKDMFILENRRFGKFIYYVECKKYSPEHPVGVRLVRELYGTVTHGRATAGLLVTSSYFSTAAKQFTEQIQTQISLMEFTDLKNWLSETTDINNFR